MPSSPLVERRASECYPVLVNWPLLVPLTATPDRRGLRLPMWHQPSRRTRDGLEASAAPAVGTLSLERGGHPAGSSGAIGRHGFGGRAGVQARSQGHWLGVHQPLLPVDEFANHVEVSGVSGGLGDHVEQDIPKICRRHSLPGNGHQAKSAPADDAAMTASTREASWR